MTLTVHHIRGNPQTGKTTMALGFLEKLHAAGHPVLYVAPTLEMARHWKRYTPVPCTGVELVRTDETRAVAVDDCGHLPAGATKRIVALWERLAALQGPAQLVLVNWRGEFPPLERRDDSPGGSAPCPHVWAHQGLVFWHSEHPMAGTSARERTYADRYFCQKCLTTNDRNARVQGHSYLAPLSGAVPR